MIAYIISALCVAVGGIFMSGRVGLTYLGMGDSYMFVTLAVVAIGGISMRYATVSIRTGIVDSNRCRVTGQHF